MNLRAATDADFSFIRGLAQRADYQPFITDEGEAGLAAYLADPAARLQIWDENGQSAGFALWCHVGHPAGVVELRRLALASAGGGKGLNFVTTLIEFGFTELGALKIWLDASAENLRARRVYEQAGFQLEGHQRGHWWRPALGRAVDLMLYGLMKEDWRGRPQGA